MVRSSPATRKQQQPPAAQPAADPQQRVREDARSHIQSQKRAMAGSRANAVDAARRQAAPLVETRVFCMAEVRPFGEERRVRLQKACAGDTFFEGFGANGAWPRQVGDPPARRGTQHPLVDPPPPLGPPQGDALVGERGESAGHLHFPTFPQTNLLCWNCAHGFEGPPLGLPKSYDDRTGQYVLTGVFCGPGCALRYCYETSPGQVAPARAGMLGDFLRKAFGREYAMHPQAPPRYMLRAFGGPLTIEEYRRPGCLHYRELRKDELIKDWAPQEVGVTVWGRLVSLRGAAVRDVEEAIQQRRPAKRPQAAETTLDSFLAIKRVKT